MHHKCCMWNGLESDKKKIYSPYYFVYNYRNYFVMLSEL